MPNLMWPAVKPSPTGSRKSVLPVYLYVNAAAFSETIAPNWYIPRGGTSSIPSSNITLPTPASNTTRSTPPPTACTASNVSGESTSGLLHMATTSRAAARIHCTSPECGHDYFRPFSCKGLYLCPSCSRKRTLFFAEHLTNEVLLELPDRRPVSILIGSPDTFLRHAARETWLRASAHSGTAPDNVPGDGVARRRSNLHGGTWCRFQGR